MSNRRNKVSKLMQLALIDRNLPKYFQARYLLGLIDNIEQSKVQDRNQFLNQLRQTA